MITNSQNMDFTISELPKIKDIEIDNLDLLLISDRSKKDGKFYSKQLSIQQMKCAMLDEIVIDGGGAKDD